MSFNYSNVLSSFQGKGLPTNQAVPNIYNGLVNPVPKTSPAPLMTLKNTSPAQVVPYARNFTPKPDIHQGLVTALNKQGGTHTTSDASGNTTTTKINPATTGTGTTGGNSSTGNTSTTSTGTTLAQDQQTASNQNKPGYDAMGNPLQSSNSTGLIIQPTAPQSTQDTSYGGLVKGLVGAGATTQQQQNATSQQISDLRQNLQTGLGGIQSQPQTLNYGLGRQNALIGQEASKESALQGQLQSQIAAGSQNIGALQGAAGLIPEALRYGGGTGSGSLVDQSVQSALTQIQNGASTSDAMANLVGGDFAKQQFIAAMQKADPNWTTTSSNAIASQNMSQGQKYQSQAQDISNALQTMSPIVQQLTSFMTKAGLDPASAPILNKQINTINAQTNPEAVATMNAAITEVRSYAIQLLGSQSGANPTDVTSAVNSFDFSNFTPVQLNTFANNLNELGQVRLSQTQSAMNTAYGKNNTTTPAAGMTAKSSGTLDTGGMVPASNAVNLLKTVGGASASTLSNLVESLGSQGGSAVAGGIAEKLFAF